MYRWLINNPTPTHPPNPQFFLQLLYQTIPLPRVKNCHPHPQIFIFNITPTIPPPLHFFPPPVAVGVINQGWGGGGGVGRGAEQCSAKATVRRKVEAHKNSVRQQCAANLRRTLCARIVRDNCALHTFGAHCVPVQCAATVCCKLAAHIVCQNSAPEK